MYRKILKKSEILKSYYSKISPENPKIPNSKLLWIQKTILDMSKNSKNKEKLNHSKWTKRSEESIGDGVLG